MMQSSTKDEVLRLLLESGEEPVSGVQLAEQIGISRTAVWKHIQSLQEDGYIVHTVKKRGYVLRQGNVEQLSHGEVQAYLRTEALGRTLYVMDEVESTQLEAHRLVAEDAPHGTIVVAETQTAGRGRMMREWDSARRKGLWFTCIVRPNCLQHEAPQFTLIAAVAIVNAVKAIYPSLNPQIKWPNDILINGRKCTGILTEMVADPDRVRALLIGIGVNVNQRLEDFPEELQEIATSLWVELDAQGDLNRSELLAEILLYLEKYSELYLRNGFSSIKPLWEAASGTIGNMVRATTLREVIVGKAIAITNSGVLQIEREDGSIAEVYSADIELV